MGGDENLEERACLEGGEENVYLVRGKELSMKDEQREGRIVKEEKRKDGLT